MSHLSKRLPLWPAVFCGVIVVGFGTDLLVGARAGESKELVTVQVRLLQDGAPVDADLDLTFEVYDAASGGNLLWSESQTGVQVRNGILVAQLGNVNPLGEVFTSGLGSDTDRWVAIKQGGSDLVPRVYITAVPYAHGASAADIASQLWDASSQQGVALSAMATELAGAGLEDSGGLLRIAASAAGAGLSGGGGSALSVNTTALINSGTAAIDGDRLEVDYSPSHYTPRIGGAAQSLDELAAHLVGIDDALSGTGGSASSFLDTKHAGGRLAISSTDLLAEGVVLTESPGQMYA